MKVDKAIEYLEIALKRSHEEEVYNLVAKVGTDFLDCMKDTAPFAKKIKSDTITTTEQLELYGPFKRLKDGSCHGPKPLNPFSSPYYKYNKWQEVSDLNKTKPELQHMYMETLKTVFTDNRNKVGIIKFCSSLTDERFAMLNADPKEDIKVKKESQNTATSAATSQTSDPISTSSSTSTLTHVFSALTMAPLFEGPKPKAPGQDSAKQAP